MSLSVPSTTLVLSSADISPQDANASFASEDPPPLGMKLRVDTEFLNLSKDSFNNTLHVHLSKYVLDCVWRDALDPAQDLTSNAGTSVSRRVKVFLYAGDPTVSPVRLLEDSVYRDASGEFPDFFVYRDQNYVNEKAHNINDTNQGMAVDLYFENQFTQQAETMVDPGMYLGKISAQAVSALKATSQITIRWKTDRTDHPSPFWYRKFLLGSSLWDPELKKFVIVDASNPEEEAQNKEYYQRLGSIAVGDEGGPYFPLTLYTFENPVNLSVAPFINDSNLMNVADPLTGETNLLNHPQATLRLSQLAVTGTTDLAAVQTTSVPLLAPSDAEAFRVPLVDTASGELNVAFAVHDSASSSFPARYADAQGNCTLHYPNGAWRGEPLSAGSTSIPDFLSPFPWERRLTADQLAVLNETLDYPVASSVYRYQVLDAQQYLFMDPGTAWNGQASPAPQGNVTVGERSLQFDFGVDRSGYVNKFQLSFPRSQEDHQPYRVQASLHKAFTGSADTVILNQRQTLWFGGVQFQGLSGSRADPWAYKFLNTHTQSAQGLLGSHTSLWDVPPRQLAGPVASPSASAIRRLDPDDYESDPAITRGRARVVRQPPGDAAATWYTGRPNDGNPSLDFTRQEFGPFTRGATLAEIKDPEVCKAWTASASASATAQPITSAGAGALTFFDLVDYIASPTGAYALGYKVYVQQTVPIWTPQHALADQGAAGWRYLAASATGDRLVAAEDPYLWTYQTGGTWTRQDSAGARPWTAVAISATGNVLMACANSPTSQLYRTEDFGASWAPVAPSPTRAWKGFAIAGDGQSGFGIAENGPIYIYRSGGGIITNAANFSANQDWFQDVSYAATGNTVVAVSDEDNGIVVSTDDGGTWARRRPPNAVLDEMVGGWVSVAVAPEGNVFVTAPSTGQLTQATLDGTGAWTYASIGPSNGWNIGWVTVAIRGPPGPSRQILATTDTGLLFKGSVSGSTWTWTNSGRIESLQERVFLKASQDGQRLVAAYEAGQVWMSYNGGGLWVTQAPALPAGEEWRAVAISADGTTVAAVIGGGYIWVGNVQANATTTTWTRADGAGERDWTCVGISENGQTLYAGSDSGFLWGSTDGGLTWKRDVSPVATAKSWTSVSVRNAKGFAVADFESNVFRINLDSPPSQTPIVEETNPTVSDWAAIDCSRDAEVVVAVPTNGLVEVSANNGETWTSVPAMGSRAWTSVAVSGDGRWALAVASDGNVARGSTTGSSRLDTWTPVTTPHTWTGVDVSDDFSTILGTVANGGIFASVDGGLTWQVDQRLPIADRAQPWQCVAVSGDGLVAAAAVGGSSGNIRLLDAGQAWNALTTSADKRALAEGTGPKILVEDPAFELSTFLQSNVNSYPAANAQSIFSTSVYEFFAQKHTVYRVDAQRQPNPSYAVLRSDLDYKAYRRPDGNLVFTTASPTAYILSTYVAAPKRLLARAWRNLPDDRYYLVHPWYDTPAKLDLVLDPDYTKYILPSALSVTQTSPIVVSAADETNSVGVAWNGATFAIALPDGAYADVQQLNASFQAGLDAHKLYLEDTGNLTRRYFVRLDPNAGEAVRLVVENPPRGATPPAGYQFPAAAGPAWPYAAAASWPALQVEEGRFGTLVGFERGTYPPASYSSPGLFYEKAPDYIPEWASVALPADYDTFRYAYEIYPEMYQLQGTLEPMLDYIVKETYYFAPKYDQYGTKQAATVGGFTAFQPAMSDVGQKMVNQSLAVGQYLGVGFGSFLFDSEDAGNRNEVYTRGRGNHMKLFSFRPMTQLFSFETDSGFLRDTAGTATAQATFTNVVEAGRITNVRVLATGAKYSGEETTAAYVHPTLDLEEQGYFYDKATGQFADTPMYLMDQATQGAAPKHATVDFTMVDDLTSEARVTYTASQKTALRRSAEFHLRISNHAKK